MFIWTQEKFPQISLLASVHAICQRPCERMAKRMHLQHLATEVWLQDSPLDMSDAGAVATGTAVGS